MKKDNTNWRRGREFVLGKILLYLNGIMLGIILGLFHESCQEGQNILPAESQKFSLRVEEDREEDKICYLTFDDGPSKNTLKILDLLEEYKGKATFFIIGNGLTEENRPILERMIKEGHSVGLHANNHVYKDFYRTENSWEKDMELLSERLKKEFGIQPAFFRFPGGSSCYYMKGNVKQHIVKMHEKGLRCFDWNVSGEDAVGNPTPASIYNNVIKGAVKYNTPIVLLHDSSVSEATTEALPDILRELSAMGYRFETLETRKEYIFRNSRP